jgi:hypothetical protein
MTSGSLAVGMSTIEGNVVSAAGTAGANGTGGGLAVAGTGVVVTRSTISRNRVTAASASAGGISLTGGGSATLTNSTLAGNRVAGTTAVGGGVALDGGSALTLRAATVARNAAANGGGILSDAGTVSLRGTILGANTAATAPDCGGTIASTGWNRVGKTAGCTFAAQPSDRADIALRLGALGANGGPTQTIPIRAGSPALDAIPRAACGVGVDQRGVRRPRGTRCDVGAYERVG